MARISKAAQVRAQKQQLKAQARADAGLPPIPVGGRLIDPKPKLKQFAKSVDEIEVLGDLLLIREIKDDVTAGGIMLPDGSTNEGPRKGEVMAAGPGLIKEDDNYSPMNCKIGDLVYCQFMTRPMMMEIGGDKYLLIPDSQVIMKVRTAATESPIVTD